MATLISLIPFATLAPFYNIPLTHDEGIFATIARDMLQGGLPYTRLFDVTPPVIYLWYALGFLVFGEAGWVPRLMLTFSLCATTLLLYIEARLLFSKGAAFGVAFIFAVSTAFSLLSVFAIDEYFVLLPLAGSFLAITLAVQRGNLLWVAAAGILGGIALLTNQSSAAHFAFLILLSLKLMERKLLATSVLLAAGGLVLAALAVPYVVTGSFGDLWYGFVEYPLRYGASMSLSEKLHRAFWSSLWFLFVTGPVVLLACRGGISLRRLGLGNRSTHIVLCWLLASLSALLLTGRFHGYYWLDLLPPLALLAGVALTHQEPARENRILVWGFTLVFAAAFLLSVLMNARMYVQPTSEGKLIASDYPEFRLRDAQTRSVGRFLAEKTSASDTIGNIGRQGNLYFYSQRRPAIRFLHEFGLVSDTNNVQIALQDLERNRPLYVLDTQWPAFLEGISKTYPWQISDYVETHYDLETRIYFDEDLLAAYKKVVVDPNRRSNLTFYGDLYRLKVAQ